MSVPLEQDNHQPPQKEFKRAGRRNFKEIMPASQSIAGLEGSLNNQIASFKQNKVHKQGNSARHNNMQLVAINKSDINTSTPIGRLKQLIQDSDPLISDLAHSVVLHNNE